MASIDPGDVPLSNRLTNRLVSSQVFPVPAAARMATLALGSVADLSILWELPVLAAAE